MLNSPALHDQWTTHLATCRSLAARAAAAGDVPVGALVLAPDGLVIGHGQNCRETAPFDPTAHAEILALREAAAHLGTWRLDGCTLVVNLEPCTMCAGAIINSRISRCVFGAWDEKAGAAGSLRDVLRDSRLNHSCEVIGGVDELACATQLKDFFASKR